MPSDMPQMSGSMPRDKTFFRMSIARSFKAIVLDVRVFAASAGMRRVLPLIHDFSMRIISPARIPVQHAKMKAAATRWVFVTGGVPSSQPATSLIASISSSEAVRSRCGFSFGRSMLWQGFDLQAP